MQNRGVVVEEGRGGAVFHVLRDMQSRKVILEGGEELCGGGREGGRSDSAFTGMPLSIKAKSCLRTQIMKILLTITTMKTRSMMLMTISLTMLFFIFFVVIVTCFFAFLHF